MDEGTSKGVVELVDALVAHVYGTRQDRTATQRRKSRARVFELLLDTDLSQPAPLRDEEVREARNYRRVAAVSYTLRCARRLEEATEFEVAVERLRRLYGPMECNGMLAILLSLQSNEDHIDQRDRRWECENFKDRSEVYSSALFEQEPGVLGDMDDMFGNVMDRAPVGVCDGFDHILRLPELPSVPLRVLEAGGGTEAGAEAVSVDLMSMVMMNQEQEKEEEEEEEEEGISEGIPEDLMLAGPAAVPPRPRPHHAKNEVPVDVSPDLWLHAARKTGTTKRPTWESAGGHHSMDYQRSGSFDAHYASTCLLGTPLPPPIDESNLVKDILSVLQGIPSSTFSLSDLTSSFHPQKGVRVTGGGWMALYHLLGSFAHTGTCFYRLECLANHFAGNSERGGLVCQAFGGALKSYLQFVRACILALPEAVRRRRIRRDPHPELMPDSSLMDEPHVPLVDPGLWKRFSESPSMAQLLSGGVPSPSPLTDVTVLEVALHARFLSRQLGVVADFCHCGERGEWRASFPRGVALLARLYQKLEEVQLSEDRRAYVLFRGFFKATMTPYFVFLQDWIYRGSVCDPHDEFVVNARSRTLLKDGDNWIRAFQTRDYAQLPVFLVDVQDTLLRCGVALNVLREAHLDHYRSCEACLEDGSVPSLSLAFTNEALSKGREQLSLLAETQHDTALMLMREIEEYDASRNAPVVVPLSLEELWARERQRDERELSFRERIALERRTRQKALMADILNQIETKRHEKRVQEERERRTEQEDAQRERDRVQQLEEEARKMLWLEHTQRMRDLEVRSLRAEWRAKRYQLDEERRSLFAEIASHERLELEGQTGLPPMPSRTNSRGSLGVLSPRIIPSRVKEKSNSHQLVEKEELVPWKKEEEKEKKEEKEEKEKEEKKEEKEKEEKKEEKEKEEKKEEKEKEEKKEEEEKEEKKDEKEIEEEEEVSAVLDTNTNDEDGNRTVHSPFNAIAWREEGTVELWDDEETEELVPLAKTIDECIVQPIRSQHQLVTAATLHLFLVHLKLRDHLAALRRYVLMNAGDFADALASMFFAGLQEGVDWCNASKANRVLELALKVTNHNTDPYSSHLTLGVDATSTPHKNRGMKALDFLSFDYNVEWPLTLVLTPSSMKLYNRIFLFLLQQKRVAFVLRDIWNYFSSQAASASYTNRAYIRQLEMFRHEIQHFVGIMQGYLISQVLEVSWKEFEDAMAKNARDMEGLRRLHEEYLETCLHRCLLDDRAAPIMDVVMSIFSLIVTFRQQIVSNPIDQITPEALCEISKTQQQYRTFVGFLYKVLARLCTRGYQPYLQELLTRLDFNGFFSQTHVPCV